MRKRVVGSTLVVGLCLALPGVVNAQDLSIDHVVPRSQGGDNSWENLVCCCVACNSRKGGRTPHQARMDLIRPPVKPRRNPVIGLRLGLDKYACWQTFLDNAYWSVELK